MKFDKPQRQSPVGIIIMFADSLQKFIRAAWVPLVIMLYRMPAQAIFYTSLMVLGLFTILVFLAYLKYRNFTFYLDQEKREFIVRSGVLSKKKISIGLEKIQQVNINQNIIQKLIGVYSLDVDTAGSNSKEVSIRAIDKKSAEILKAKLLDREVMTHRESVQPEEILVKPFIKISPLSLLKLGITSNYGRSLGVLIAFLITVYDNIREFLENEILTEEQIQQYVVRSTLQGFLMIFLVMFLLVFIINLIRTLIRYFDLEIRRQSQSLLISYGLLAKKNTLLNPRKVQIVAYSQNLFQRKLNVLSFRIKQASSEEVKEDGKKNESSAIEIPGASTAERDEILKLIYDKIFTKGQELKPNYRYIFKRIYLLLLLPVAAILLFGYFVNPHIQAYFILLPFYVGLMSLLIYIGYRNYRFYVNDDFILKKRGLWDIDYVIIEPYKIQSITTKQYFWHKRSDVGHVILHTAAGDVSFTFANFSQINSFINYWLYKIESSDKDWM